MAKVHIHWHDSALYSISPWRTFCGAYSGNGIPTGISTVTRWERDQATCKTCLKRCRPPRADPQGDAG